MTAPTAVFPREPSSPDADRTAAVRARSVWRFVRWLGASPDVAADLTQETMLRWLQCPPDAADEAAVSAWLRRVARNLFRAAAVRTRPGVPLDDVGLLEVAWREFARDDAGDRRLAALRACLDELPERSRSAVNLHYRHGLPQARLAEAMGLSAPGVKRLLHRVRVGLGRCVERRTAEDDEVRRIEEREVES